MPADAYRGPMRRTLFAILAACALLALPGATAEYVDPEDVIDQVVGPDPPPGHGCRPTCLPEEEPGPPGPPPGV